MKRIFALSLLLLATACNEDLLQEEEEPSESLVRKRTEKAVRNQEEKFQTTPKVKSLRQEEQMKEERVREHDKL